MMCTFMCVVLLFWLSTAIKCVLRDDGNKFSSSSSRNTNLVVWMDPFVSIKDTMQPYPYTETTLTPLLEKIASRFSQIMVHITLNELLDSTSWNVIVFNAVAKLNKREALIGNSRNPFLQVWISFHYVNPSNKEYSRNVTFHMSLISELCAKANTIYIGTIYALTMHIDKGLESEDDFRFKRNAMKILSESRTGFPATSYYKLGVMYGLHECYYSPVSRIPYLKWIAQYSDVILYDVLTQKGSFGINGINNIEDSILWLKSAINQCNVKLKTVYGKEKFDMAMSIAWSDTNTKGSLDFSQLISGWKAVASLSRETNITFVMDRAFDTPTLLPLVPGTQGCGWWRLLENHNYKDPTEYVFQEKEQLVKDGSNGNIRNISKTWLEEPANFFFDQVGVSMPMFQRGSSLFTYYDQYDVTEIVEQSMRQISKSFQTVMLTYGDLMIRQNPNQSELSNVGVKISFKGNNNIKIILALDIASETKNTSGITSTAYLNFMSIFTDTSSGLSENDVGLILFRLEDWEYDSEIISNIQAFKGKVSKSVDVGVVLPLVEWCLNKGNLTNPLDNAHTIGIATEVDWLKLTFNIERYLSQFIIFLEMCQNRLSKNIPISNENKPLELVFIVEWSGIKMGKGELYQVTSFVQFWEGLGKWAKEQDKTTVILGEAFDLVTDKDGGKPDGWWTISVEDSNARLGRSTIHFEDKKTAALKLFKEQEKSTNFATSLVTSEIIGIASSILIIAIGIVIALQIYIWRRARIYQFVTKEEVKAFFNGDSGTEVSSMNRNNVGEGPSKGLRCYNRDRYEISKGRFAIDEQPDAYLGDGEFGFVCRAQVFRDGGQVIPVAVKMAKLPPKREALLGLMSEIKLLSYIGKHENIVELMGAYTEELHRSVIYVFIELCPLGSLHAFLRKIKPNSRRISGNYDNDVVGDNGSGYQNLQRQECLDPAISAEFFQWSIEIAKGMEYLVSKHVVHADLAARNILLSLDRKIKISDFGLSRRLYNYQCYVKAGKDPLPWRWMAPESLRYSRFTEKTDVWTYGITLWEMYTYIRYLCNKRETPYPGTSWDPQFPLHLERGLRLAEPKYNEKSMYSLMLGCWNYNPDRRHAFSDILALLELRKRNLLN